MSVVPPAFFDRPVVEVAHDLVGTLLTFGATSGVIVETEAYHESEPSCHAHVGLTNRTRVLFAGPGTAYVYRSYGIHALLNAVCEPRGTGAAVLIRALAPQTGLDAMRARRGLDRERDLCSGPGKLSQALGIGLEHNGSDLVTGPIRIHAGPEQPEVLASAPRIGITRAVELPWRFSVRDSPFVSRPRPRLPEPAHSSGTAPPPSALGS